MKVLSLSTYPILARLHGGQRRINAFGDFYRSLGATFHYAAAYIPVPNHREPTGPDDHIVRIPTPRWDGVPFVADLAAGEAAAQRPESFRHFAQLFDRIRPDFVQLDQPFMWPVVERAKREGMLAGAQVIYSSQNWEAPLKERMLRDFVSPGRAAEIGAEVEALERAAAVGSSVVIAVSEADAAIYRAMGLQAPIFKVPNGVDRPPADIDGQDPILLPFEGRRYCYFVGSAYPPNSEGFCKLVLEGNLFFHPPAPFIALCGGAGHEVLKSRAYRRFTGAHEARIRPFPAISDAQLSILKRHAHVALLPIDFGGGSNLKTAEALAAGAWVIGTSIALRGFEAFADAAGVLRADTPSAFRRAMIDVMQRPRLKLSQAELEKRDGLYWDRCFADSGLKAFILGAAPGR